MIRIDTGPCTWCRTFWATSLNLTLYFYCLYFYLFVFVTISCNSDWPGTCPVSKAGFKFLISSFFLSLLNPRIPSVRQHLVSSRLLVIASIFGAGAAVDVEIFFFSFRMRGPYQREIFSLLNDHSNFPVSLTY